MSFFHAFFECFSITDYTRFNHLTKQIITFTGTLSHSGKYGKTIMLLGNVINELHNKYSFTHSGPAKQTDLTSF